jgi:hypothetical protein
VRVCFKLRIEPVLLVFVLSPSHLHRPSCEPIANSGTGAAAPVVPPVLQPWTKQQERVCMARQVHMGCRIYIHFHLRPCL